jgi:cytochrome c oxidase subunit 2
MQHNAVSRRICKRYFLYFDSILLLFSTLLSGCSSEVHNPFSTPSMLDPHGPGAAHIADLWWVMLGFGTFIFVLVTVLLFAALLRRRRATNETPPDRNRDIGRNWLIWGGIVLPITILIIIFGYNIYTLAAVENAYANPSLHIQIVGRRWWWEVNYPDQGFTTANEIHIPVGVSVEVELQSADVIHSFWVPQLHGKVDLIPAQINHISIQADSAGNYRGQCAEYCGLQHAHMGFIVVAQSQEEFDAWIVAQQQLAAAPESDAEIRGRQVFIEEGCIYCHTVRGINDTDIDGSSVDLGPDLTHLYSRIMIAASSMINDRGDLAGWIVDSQHVKPGNLMPNMYINSEDLQALLAYLENLH